VDGYIFTFAQGQNSLLYRMLQAVENWREVITALSCWVPAQNAPQYSALTYRSRNRFIWESSVAASKALQQFSWQCLHAAEQIHLY